MKKKQNFPILKSNPSLDKRYISAEKRIVDYEVELHWHDYIELELVIEGRGAHIFNGNISSLEKGTIIFSTGSDYHYIMPEKEITIFNLNFNLNIISDELRKKLETLTCGICTKLDTDTYETLKSLFEILIEEAGNKDASSLYMSNIIECIFIKLFNSVISIYTTTLPSLMQKAIIYVRSHFIDNPSIEDVADMFNYNPKYFGTLFRKTTGFGFSDYLSKLKVNYSQLLLTTTELDIERICFEAGFASTTTFRRVFKEYCGISPRDYRNNKKNILNTVPNIGWENKTTKD